MTDMRYALLDPTGNRTVLAETPTPEAEQPAVAARLMELEPSAEQVGFYSADGDRISLRMAGGEFCGNASMCAAVLAAMDRGVSRGTLSIDVSGAADPVEVTVCALEDGGYRGTVRMPGPVSVGTESFPDGSSFPVVRFGGISHVVAEGALSCDEAEAAAEEWCRYLGADALGIMLFDREAGTLAPLVYVPAAGTLCWERSCASGTTAVGAYLASAGSPISLSLIQPGGILRIEADPSGDLFLTGTVRLIRRRTVRETE